ncbi:MAG: hypothetical protein M3252_06460 [Actinomycetota bacterium]|nr:hypothetical protein [Actinomycetota bacterium]
MKRRRILVAVTLLFALQAAALPGDLEAHPSTYCGHGSSGYTITSRFEREWWAPDGHYHEYSHRRWGGWEIHPRVVKPCPH